MALRTIGFGQTFPGPTSALAGSNPGDDLEVREEDAFGGNVYDESVNVNVANVTLRSFNGRFKWTCRQIRTQVDCTIEDVMAGPSRFFSTFMEVQTASIVKVNGCFMFAPAGIVSGRQGISQAVGSTVNVENCIFWWLTTAIGSNTDPTTTLEVFHCTFVECATGVALAGSPVHDISDNLFVTTPAQVTNFVTGSNNASTGTAIGTSGVDNLTTSELGFARDFVPSTNSEFFFDFRGVEAQMSRYKDAGISKGVTTDFNGRTRSATTPNIGAAEGFAIVGAAPSEPVIAFVSTVSGQFTISITGDVGVTNQVRFRKTGAWTAGVTRSGDGNATQTGLTDGDALQVEVQASSGGVSGFTSNSIWIVVGQDGTSSATKRLGKYVEAIRDLCLNSSNLLAWIQSVDGTETTSGHVKLGFDPRTLKNEATKGPNILVRVEGYETVNVKSDKTFEDRVTVLVEFIWALDSHVADPFIAELDFIYGLIEEAKGKGRTIVAGASGNIEVVTVDDLIVENPGRRFERHVQLRFRLLYAGPSV